MDQARRLADRAMHLEHVRVDVTPDSIRIQAVCGPSNSDNDVACGAGSVIDWYTIPRPR